MLVHILQAIEDKNGETLKEFLQQWHPHIGTLKNNHHYFDMTVFLKMIESRWVEGWKNIWEDHGDILKSEIKEALSNKVCHPILERIVHLAHPFALQEIIKLFPEATQTSFENEKTLFQYLFESVRDYVWNQIPEQDVIDCITLFSEQGVDITKPVEIHSEFVTLFSYALSQKKYRVAQYLLPFQSEEALNSIKALGEQWFVQQKECSEHEEAFIKAWVLAHTKILYQAPPHWFHSFRIYEVLSTEQHKQIWQTRITQSDEDFNTPLHSLLSFNQHPHWEVAVSVMKQSFLLENQKNKIGESPKMIYEFYQQQGLK